MENLKISKMKLAILQLHTVIMLQGCQTIFTSDYTVDNLF